MNTREMSCSNTVACSNKTEQRREHVCSNRFSKRASIEKGDDVSKGEQPQ